MLNLSPPKQVFEVLDVLKTNIAINENDFKKAYDDLLVYEGVVKGKVEILVLEKEKFQKEVRKLNEELGRIESEKKNVEGLLEAANAKLDACSFLKRAENEVIPAYLRNAKYLDPVEKWYISIRYELTPGAKILSTRLKQNYEDVWEVSQLLVRMFRGLSSTILHSHNPNRVQFTEKEWKELFQCTDINVKDDQKRVQQALQPITVDQLGQVSLIAHFVLHVSGIGLNLDNNTEYEETTKIKHKCSTYAKTMSNFCYPVNNEGNYKNEVVFQVNEEDDTIIVALETELRDNLKEEFKNTMKIRKMKIFSRKSSTNSQSGSQDLNFKRQRTDFPFEHPHSSSRWSAVDQYSSQYSSDSQHCQPHDSNYSRLRRYNRNHYPHPNRNKYSRYDRNHYSDYHY